MANVRTRGLTAKTTALDATEWLLVDKDGSNEETKALRPPIMTAAQFGAGTDAIPRFAPANALASAVRWIGAVAANTLKRVGSIMTSGGGTYIVHTQVAADQSIAQSIASGVATRIDRPPDMVDGHVTSGNNATRSVPTATQLKLAVDTFAHIAIRDGPGEAGGFKFQALSQTQYDAFASDSDDGTPDDNTVYFITG